ncbi:hypothetical protein, partial [Listeria monocytogenes]|uniref:hypothetical protein n=1 Tax=Listeria monocytogenes TaxID=1639 RepID=UPI0037A1230C
LFFSSAFFFFFIGYFGVVFVSCFFFSSRRRPTGCLGVYGASSGVEEVEVRFLLAAKCLQKMN